MCASLSQVGNAVDVLALALKLEALLLSCVNGGCGGVRKIAFENLVKTCEEDQQAHVEWVVLKALCLEQTQETPITKVITMKTKITLAAALVMTAFSFCNTATTQAAPAFVRLGDIAAEMLWMELLESDPDRSSSYTEVECVYMTLRGLGFDDDEAIVGLVLMGEGFTLNETVQCLTSATSIVDPNVRVDRSSGERDLQVTVSLSQGALR